MNALVLLDLDGTLYQAGAPVPGAVGAVRRLRAAGHTLRFFTNTDSQATGALLERVRGLGFDVEEGELFTPVVAARRVLAGCPGSRSLLLVSAAVREELREAARKRRDQVSPTSKDSMNEAERVLLRALVSPPESRIFLRVSQAMHNQPQSFEGLGVARMLALLRDRGSLEPMVAVPDPVQRALLAQVLLREAGEVEIEQVEAALESLKYRQLEALQRRVRADIAEAERRGDWAQLAVFMAEKLKVDRQMRDVDV